MEGISQKSPEDRLLEGNDDETDDDTLRSVSDSDVGNSDVCEDSTSANACGGSLVGVWASKK